METKLYLIALLLIASILVGCTQQDFTPIKTPTPQLTPSQHSEVTETKLPAPTQTPTAHPKNASLVQPEPAVTEILTPTPSQNTPTPALTSTPIETPAVTPTPTITTPAQSSTSKPNEPPTVRIIEPKDGEVIKSFYLPTFVQIRVEVGDDKDIDRVEFYVDGELKETSYFFHSATAYLDEGVHTIKVIAYDNEGLKSEDTVTVYVEKATPSHTPTPESNEPPRVRIIEPKDGEVIQTRDLPASVTIRVEASDDKFVDKIEFYVDGTLKETTYFSRSITVYLEEGTHTIRVVAYDSDGLTDDATVSIRVEKIPEPTPTPNPFVDEYEDDDSIKQAKPITVGEVQHHKFDSSSDRDWLYFKASAGKKYVVEIVDSDVTVSISIYDANENLLASTTLFEEKLEWICEKSGTYYIKLSPSFLLGEGGNYSVRLTETVVEPTPTPFTFEYGVKYKVKVLDVIDGDTIDVLLPDGSIERVRMLGVDTPEKDLGDNKPYEYDSITDLNYLAEWGVKAAQFTESKLEGKYVYIEFDEVAGIRGYYGRLLAYVYLEDGTDFTAELVKQGYARAYVEGEFKKEDYYVKLEEEAKREGRGLWSILTTTTTPTPDSTLTTSVKITYVHYDAYGNDNYNLNDEYVVIKNVGDTSVNLEGWILRDEAGHTFVFPSIILDPGETITIYSGSGVNTDSELYWGSTRAIWNNDGDTAFLYDANRNLIDAYSW